MQMIIPLLAKYELLKLKKNGRHQLTQCKIKYNNKTLRKIIFAFKEE